jgi:hypothetical protein
MLKNLLIVAAVMVIAANARANEVQKVSSKVQKVTVFLNGAQVTRTAMVNINPGVSQIVFGGISPGLDAQSIQVKANGAFTILSVKHELDFLDDQAKEKQVDDLRAIQKTIRNNISMQNSLLTIYQAEENMIDKNQVVTSQNSGLDVTKLKEALDFQTARLTDLKEKELGIGNQLVLLNEQLAKYDKQIAEIDKSGSSATSNIIVTVSSKITTQSQFTLNYVVHNASWFPTYDVRAKDVSKPIVISYKANVSQNCGEDWKDVKLTLSTGNPTVSGNKPELRPDYLNFGMYYTDQQGSLDRVSGKIIGADDKLPVVGATIRVKGSSIGTVSDVNGYFSLQVPPNAKSLVVAYIGYETVERPVSFTAMMIELAPAASALNEVVVIGYSSTNGNDYSPSPKKEPLRQIETIPVPVSKIENQTNVQFDIEEPYSIPPDGKQYTVDINEVEVKASYEYAVTPKLSPDVFLKARLTDWNKYNFLPGEANIFFEGTFIGKSIINSDATKDTLDISLGTDKNIVVTRTALKELSAKQAFGSNNKETKDWQIDIKNRKGQAINLLVEDQVPVSENGAIDVETQTISGGKLEAHTGKISWYLALNPQDEKTIELKYQVKYPKNQSVIVQ